MRGRVEEIFPISLTKLPCNWRMQPESEMLDQLQKLESLNISVDMLEVQFLSDTSISSHGISGGRLCLLFCLKLSSILLSKNIM